MASDQNLVSSSNPLVSTGGRGELMGVGGELEPMPAPTKTRSIPIEIVFSNQFLNHFSRFLYSSPPSELWRQPTERKRKFKWVNDSEDKVIRDIKMYVY